MDADFDYERHVFKAPELESVVKKAVDYFANSPLQTFPPLGKIKGAGVYGLYYFGDYELYAPISVANRHNGSQPIYIGKAVLPGNRTGFKGGDISLLGRLRQHARSIGVTSNLKIEDFKCRFVFFEGIEHDLIGSVETGLIKYYRPLWNSRIIDGFGNHDPGNGRYKQKRSAWDTFHPGRAWVLKLTGEPRNPDIIKEEALRFLEAPQEADLLESTDDSPQQGSLLS